MAAMRESFMLPSIKCSICGTDVEISLMGDHICGSNDSGRNALSKSEPRSASSQPQRYLNLPPIDPAVANRPYLGPDQLTPASSASGSWTHSPATPLDGQPLPNARHPRKQERAQPPMYNLDCAFPTFQAPALSPALSPDDSPTIPTFVDAPRDSVHQAPKSPGLDGTRNVRARMNALAPGPFGSSGGFSGSGPRNQSRRPSVDPPFPIAPIRSSVNSHTKNESRLESFSVPRKSIGVEDKNGHYIAATKLADQYHLNRAETMPNPPKLDTVNVPPTRSQTLSEKTTYKSPTGRTPPHPGLGLPRTPSQTVKQHQRNKSSIASLSKGLPPPPEIPAEHRSRPFVDTSIPRSNPTRSPSPRSPPQRRRQSPELGNYAVGNPYGSYTTTNSMSSDEFSRSSKRTDSSMSSPPTSEISLVSKNNGPDFVDPKSQYYKRHISKRSYSIKEIDDLMKNLRSDKAEETQVPPIPDHYREPSPRPPPTPEPVPQPSTSPRPPPEVSLPLLDVVPPPLSRTPSRGHKRTPTYKGPCRGCGEAIMGKSISSADGRLTGRYHKACFVCQHCRQPFASAEFYVMDNLPYCERHYHQLNHSLCRTCDRGIEGPCLETERRERFHPGCFRCYQCRCPLGDDYYEINGNPFCDRHARGMMNRPAPRPGGLGVSAGAGAGGGLHPTTRVERRRTKLMFMGPQPGQQSPRPGPNMRLQQQEEQRQQQQWPGGRF